MNLAATLCALMAAVGMFAVLAGIIAVRRFAALPPPPRAYGPQARPACTILRPLCGVEPGLDEALDSLAAQAYPAFQIVLGMQDATDPALAAAQRFAARHPRLDITVVVNPTLHGANRKISNLINMLPAAKHATLVFSDSDLHVAADYLDQLAATLQTPGAGMATTLCVSRLAQPSLAGRLAALHMRYCFLPGALLGHWAGRQDCLGNTMAIHRATLARVGGLRVLADQLADDNVLGQLVVALGLRVALAPTITAATVTESTMRGLWQHELRWARTIRSLFPLAFASSIIHFPLFWAFVAVLAAPARPELMALLAIAFALRAYAARAIDEALARRFNVRPERGFLGLLMLRDALSVVMVAASFLGRTVTWRGHVLRADGIRAPGLQSVMARSGS